MVYHGFSCFVMVYDGLNMDPQVQWVIITAFNGQLRGILEISDTPILEHCFFVARFDFWRMFVTFVRHTFLVIIHVSLPDLCTNVEYSYVWYRNLLWVGFTLGWTRNSWLWILAS